MRVGDLICVMCLPAGKHQVKGHVEGVVIEEICDLLMAREVVRQHRCEEGKLSGVVCQIFLSKFELPLKIAFRHNGDRRNRLRRYCSPERSFAL